MSNSLNVVQETTLINSNQWLITNLGRFNISMNYEFYIETVLVGG